MINVLLGNVNIGPTLSKNVKVPACVVAQYKLTHWMDREARTSVASRRFLMTVIAAL